MTTAEAMRAIQRLDRNTRPAPKRPDIVVNVCHWCGAMWATYAGSLPRGWARTDKGLCCRRCRP